MRFRSPKVKRGRMILTASGIKSSFFRRAKGNEFIAGLLRHGKGAGDLDSFIFFFYGNDHLLIGYITGRFLYTLFD